MQTTHYNYRQLQTTLKNAKSEGLLPKSFRLTQPKVVLQAKLAELRNECYYLNITFEGITSKLEDNLKKILASHADLELTLEELDYSEDELDPLPLAESLVPRSATRRSSNWCAYESPCDGGSVASASWCCWPSGETPEVAASASIYDATTVLKAIKHLDQETNSDNYLPIFHLREVFPNRERLDSALYTLQREGKVKFSRLCNASKFAPEQYEAGIKQEVGGPIFYLIAA